MKIYFDMDGTIANLYRGNWLERIMNNDATIYAEAPELVNEAELIRLVENGYELGVISWLARNGSKEYNAEVRAAKKNWLKAHYPNITFKEIHIVKYGTPKYKVANEKGILVDDEERNRNEWKWLAIEPHELETLI